MRRVAPWLLALGVALGAGPVEAAGWTLVGWNDLGMHCMDDDYSVFSILPPYNVIHASLTDPSGNLIRDAVGITVTYEAVADPSGSIDRSSAGKTNFWSYVEPLFGVPLPVDQGLAGFDMPGAGNAPQAMRFDADRSWWSAEGIPLTPTDDAGRGNTYPLMRLTARDGSGHVLASTDIVLPVSTEMTCVACHASGSSDAAMPSLGWVDDPTPSVDYRLNILRLHDELAAGSQFTAALDAAGYDPSGLEATARGGTPVLCARCHSSNALPGTTVQDVGALTHVVHARHAFVVDPASGLPLGADANRSACYRCHPGSETRCLRGAMGSAVAPDGSLSMQCQSCHGGMAAVGSPSRHGWLDEPSCQSCHTGTATHNSGQIRYTSVFEPSGQPRVAADDTFATTPNQPAAGFSLYRFSAGHGGLACESCHGSTHAVYPSAEENDNLQSVAIQGHEGMLADCGSCHAGSVPFTASGGPHGMHTIGAAWVSGHGEGSDRAGTGDCRGCHGSDFRGTVLSQALGDRSFSTELGRVSYFRGARVSCYGCHNGPGSENRTRNRKPSANDLNVSTPEATPVSVTLSASDPDRDTLTFRIISQPAHGTVGLTGSTARYFPEAGFTGNDVFTWSAWDGSIDSNLASGRVNVGGPPSGGTPTVSKVKGTKKPFRIVVKGGGFDPGVEVSVDSAPWAEVKRVSASKVVLKGGKALKQLFPKGSFVPIELANPGGASVTVSYDRGSKTFH